jgi:hypothetical protein
MSKWINTDLFGQFQKQKKEEKEKQPSTGFQSRTEFIWETPDKGTDTQPKIYTIRFIPDQKGVFYKEYSYHMFKSGEKWVFAICPKTEGFDKFCPVCAATSKLYTGTAADKVMAANYKRKKKYVGNITIVDDPRDSERQEEKDKCNGKVKLYEFPQKVEAKLKEEITDSKNGLGPAIFDPGPDGFNFLLKVGATKKDGAGKEWPDYANSTFSRRPEALGTDEEIDKIMKSTIGIDDYINSLKKSDEELVKIMKDEMLYDLIKDDVENYLTKKGRVAPKELREEEDIPEKEIYANAAKKDEEEPFYTDAEMKANEEKAKGGKKSDDDEELLKELENM